MYLYEHYYNKHKNRSYYSNKINATTQTYQCLTDLWELMDIIPLNQSIIVNFYLLSIYTFNKFFTPLKPSHINASQTNIFYAILHRIGERCIINL